MNPRSRRIIDGYCAVTVMATVVWWVLLFASPSALPIFFGNAGAPIAWTFLPGDGFSALLLPIAIGMAARKALSWLPWLVWLHAGCQTYALLVTLGLAILDPKAYWGVVAMFLSAGAAMAVALMVSELPILWGPFRFRLAPERSVRQNLSHALAQTATMWLVFFGVIPGAIRFVEVQLGWSAMIPDFGHARVIAVVLFVGLGALGLWGAWEFARVGNGTPLPRAGTHDLVTSGIYSVIRNPMAAFGIAQGVCLGIAIQSPLVAVYAILGGIMWDLLVRPKEEAYLESEHGSRFRAYRDAVPCWVPRLSRYRPRP